MIIRNDLKQGSPEWLKWRKSVITATDAASILGINPFKSAYKLWREKLGMDVEDEPNDKMLEGIAMEPVARSLAEMYFGFRLKPAVVQNDFLGASLDGISEDLKTVVEIKCGQSAYNKAVLGIIPDYYVAQMQHQMLLTSVDEISYFTYNGKNSMMLVCKRDDEFIKTMVKKEKDFWHCLQSLETPELDERDYIQNVSPEWEFAADMYRLAREKKKELEDVEEKYRLQLIKLSGGKNCFGNGIKLTKVMRKGAVDWQSIPELKDIDLSPYRKKSIETWRITVNDGAAT